MSTIQDLLNKEAQLANSGHDKTSPERKEIHIVIRKLRDKLYMPLCFGQDDCSTQLLSTCPWRFDCGE